MRQQSEPSQATISLLQYHVSRGTAGTLLPKEVEWLNRQFGFDLIVALFPEWELFASFRSCDD